MSKVREPKSHSNSSAVKDTTKQKSRVSQQRPSDKKTVRAKEQDKVKQGEMTET